jgi:hypothetical protein
MGDLHFQIEASMARRGRGGFVKRGHRQGRGGLGGIPTGVPAVGNRAMTRAGWTDYDNETTSGASPFTQR